MLCISDQMDSEIMCDIFICGKKIFVKCICRFNIKYLHFLCDSKVCSKQI